MQILGLRTTIYRVSDLSKATQWYSDVLGFPPYFDEPFYVGFNVGGFELGLQPEEGAVKTKSEGVNTYWGVENVEASFAKLISMGATEHEKPIDVGGGIQVAMVKDPWDNLFGVIFNPHFVQEKING
jgi:catechol 2,3-dioxygenase-like lactoylglutathione lyase family enzyme